MSYKNRLNIWMFFLGFSLTTIYYFTSYAQETILSQKSCTGALTDLNCYQNVIKKEAHRLNVEQGFVATNEEDQQNGLVNKVTYEGRKILVDIQDQESCFEVSRFLENQNNFKKANGQSMSINRLCEKDPAWPEERYRSITVMWETQQDFLSSINLDPLRNTDKNLFNETRNLSYYMLGTLGFFWVLPESISQWDRDKVRSVGFGNMWLENVKSKPQMDKDAAYLNYVSHPIAGSIYYNIARSNGQSKLASFGYSVIMSTFFWEYGFEAIAEKPSIQDLIITPIIGSILGEFVYRWINNIKNSDGRIMGSKTFGSVMLFMLNPAEKMTEKLNQILGSNVIKNAKSNLVLSKRKSKLYPNKSINYIGVELKFQF